MPKHTTKTLAEYTVHTEALRALAIAKVHPELLTGTNMSYMTIDELLTAMVLYEQKVGPVNGGFDSLFDPDLALSDEAKKAICLTNNVKRSWIVVDEEEKKQMRAAIPFAERIIQAADFFGRNMMRKQLYFDHCLDGGICDDPLALDREVKAEFDKRRAAVAKHFQIAKATPKQASQEEISIWNHLLCNILYRNAFGPNAGGVTREGKNVKSPYTHIGRFGQLDLPERA